MKKILTTLVAIVAIAQISHAQWNTSVSGKIITTDNVGIGTTTPNSKLDVTGIIRYGNNSGGIGALSYSTSGLITLESASSNTSISLLPSGTGNVGVGTTNPQATLSIKGSSLPSSQWWGYTSSLQVGELMIQDYNVLPQVGIGQNTYYDGTSNKYILDGYASGINMGANGNIAFSVFNSGTSGNTVSGTGIAMTIANNGYVGVGTTAPDAKLTVNGTFTPKK